MKISTAVSLVLAAFVGGLLLDSSIFGLGEAGFSKKVSCSSFKEQAESRIKDYYAPSEVVSYTPDEIFFSTSKETCIAAWSGDWLNENGMFKQVAIFDAVSNRDIYSDMVYRPFVKESEDIDNFYRRTVNRYDELLVELR
ncbi:hypothetical protein JXR01_03610 [Candidatus Kaiserbacteria bacterium]|nr:MAG: hypothetical protein JXR01_03610 [Candidatus Kaiserbacteria bacterium]